jgi:hypothetical protein
MNNNDTNVKPAPVLNPQSLGILRYFKYEHLQGQLRITSSHCAELAHNMVEGAVSASERGETVDVAELVAGLRKLLEAKDCFVRARLQK